MAISIAWDNVEKTIIRYDFESQWTWQDLRAAIESDDAMIASVAHTVHLIFDLRQVEGIPPNPMAQFRHIAAMIHPRLGMIVFVGADSWTRTVLEIFYQVYGTRLEGLSGVASVRTLEEARAIITTHIVQTP